MQRYDYLKGLAILEGTSLVALIFIAMPLKYAFGYPQAVSIIGLLHGILFMTFSALLAAYALKGWLTEMQAFRGFLAALIPFGTFIYQATTLRKLGHR